MLESTERGKRFCYYFTLYGKIRNFTLTSTCYSKFRNFGSLKFRKWLTEILRLNMILGIIETDLQMRTLNQTQRKNYENFRKTSNIFLVIC